MPRWADWSTGCPLWIQDRYQNAVIGQPVSQWLGTRYPDHMPPASNPTVDEIAAALGGVSANTVVAEVAARMLEYLTSGQLLPGSRLPPERQLAASLGVGRSAVREALAALHILGIVDIRPGSGSYVRGSASELLPQTLTWGLMLNGQSTMHLLEVRYGLEVYAAELAAERATKENIAELSNCLKTMKATVKSLDGFVDADMRFHREVAIASGNPVLGDLLRSVRSLLRIWTERAIHDPGLADVTVAEHGAVLKAIRAHDPEAAGAAMRSHMVSATGRLRGAYLAEHSEAE